jgi:hypothetical protein
MLIKKIIFEDPNVPCFFSKSNQQCLNVFDGVVLENDFLKLTL